MKERAKISASEWSPEKAQYIEEPPSKKRKIERKKSESPPWKKAIADGPSSFTQQGKKRSGRLNSIPIELQPASEKRSTRASPKFYSTRSRGHEKKLKGPRSYPLGSEINALASDNISHKSESYALVPRSKTSPKYTSPKRFNHKSLKVSSNKTSPQSLKEISSPKTPSILQETLHLKKIIRLEEDIDQDSGNRPKIKLRVKPPSLPIIHPGLVLTRPRQYSNLQEYFKYADQKHVNDGGLFHPELSSEYSTESALQDALILLRAEKAAEPGGILAHEKCRIFNEVEESPKIPPQYAHLDHLCRAATGFRKLVLIEQKNHRQSAKRIAEACVDEWFRRQPKTAEQLEAELMTTSKLRYRNVMKILKATWDNVATEINRQRLLEWEVQEQARVRKALSEAVDKSQQKLQQRKACMNIEALTDEDERVSELESELDADGDGENPKTTLDCNDNESNMSQEDSEVDEDVSMMNNGEDDKLTVEKLREKYAALSEKVNEQLSNEVINAVNLSTGAVNFETEVSYEQRYSSDDNDESIDMDDDLSSRSEVSSNSMDEDEDNKDIGETSLGFLTRAGFEVIGREKIHPLSKSNTAECQDKEEISDTVRVRDSNVHITATSKSDQNRTHLQTNNELKIQKIDPLSAENIRHSAMASPISLKQISEAISSESSGLQEKRISSTAENNSSFSPESVLSTPKNTQCTTPQSDNQIRTSVPFLLRGTLREYQHYGLDWLAGLYANNTNGILADEMGLGKTIQTIALLAHLACVHEEWGPHLVIVPTSVILNWEMEFKKWCPGLKIMTYYGSVEERKKKRIGWRNKDMWNVCITSYQLIIRDQQVFKRRRWHYMILDEAHNIKNFNSQRWQTMLTFNTRARLLLTGTPLQNNLTELWSLLYFLMPSDGTNGGVGGFTDLKEFQDWFKKPSEQILEHGRDQMDNESWGIINKLHKLLRPYLLRRLKADVEKQLPAKFEHIEFCRLSKRQRELYDGFLNRDDTRETLAFGNNLSIINCLMQLRKVCNHPDLFIDRPISTSFPMDKSVVADFEIKELLVRRRLIKEDPMTKVSLEFLNLLPTRYEKLSAYAASRTAMLSAHRKIMELREIQRSRAQEASTKYDPSTTKSNLACLENSLRWGRFEELQHCVYLNALRRQQRPIYGVELVQLLTLGINEINPKPKKRHQVMSWLENTSPVLSDLVKPISARAEAYQGIIQRFTCLTPAVIAKDLTIFTLTPQGLAIIQDQIDTSKLDPFHEARMRLSIQFPDKRLLQYDCGKLQTLDKLLRKLQAGSHRALIFTQMTKVLDILEQFLNIHGHKYLRLDGSTKIEQRQILTDRFNHDTRILAFILSSRSGGLGINLTGADTVIFYDLDWNPAMDKQCQDRCHRIGQTRDVHIYRLVSEHTIEVNILRKANQKRMLDDVVIQEGDFTTDYFNKISVKDIIDKNSFYADNDAVANAAVDRILGGSSSKEAHDFSQAEDQEDVIAAKLAEREIVQTDAGDFEESSVFAAENTGHDTADLLEDMKFDSTQAAVEDDEVELNAWGERIQSMDHYMLTFMREQLKNISLELPKDRNKTRRIKENRLNRTRQ